jgi:hypothetical protein
MIQLAVDNNRHTNKSILVFPKMLSICRLYVKKDVQQAEDVMILRKRL